MKVVVYQGQQHQQAVQVAPITAKLNKQTPTNLPLLHHSVPGVQAVVRLIWVMHKVLDTRVKRVGSAAVVVASATVHMTVRHTDPRADLAVDRVAAFSPVVKVVPDLEARYLPGRVLRSPCATLPFPAVKFRLVTEDILHSTT